ncbi:hypothetical protein FACS18942_05030 [Planctomycetales bacterium]|nr:hypothetical protein FACS18942_05030 [Planctomycetales bacterium]GHT37035.1 hypothetical protein FACS189427_09500 [Planctomycetales bacterium]
MKLCLQAGIGVYVGNDVAVGANKQNTDGLRIAVLSGGWSHSTAFIGYVRENGTDYYLWRNSHGARYSSGDKYGTPNDCCWMTEDMLNRFMNRMSGYGGAFAILPKSVKQ